MFYESCQKPPTTTAHEDEEEKKENAEIIEKKSRKTNKQGWSNRVKSPNTCRMT